MKSREQEGGAFLPRMQSEAKGFHLVDDLAWRSWSGIVADVWHVRCDPDANGYYTSPDPRLFVVLDISEGGEFVLEASDGATGSHKTRFSMAYIPARVPIRSRVQGAEKLRHLDIHLPEGAIARRFGRSLGHGRLNQLRLQFDDERLSAIAALIARECTTAERLDDRYGIGLVDALLAVLFDIQAEKPRSRPTLSRQQLDRSLDYMDHHCFEPIRLADLASLLGLSETYFSHAFKASTGVPPLRWQMEARIGKVKEMLAAERLTLTEISAISGFADQAHLTRSFKRCVGMTPSEWRRGQSSGQL